jgi:acyl carrier protein
MSQQIQSSVGQTTHTIIAQVLGIRPDEVHARASLAGDLRATSLDMLEIVMALEDAFHVEISDRDAATVARVEDLETLVRRRQAIETTTKATVFPAAEPPARQ